MCHLQQVHESRVTFQFPHIWEKGGGHFGPLSFPPPTDFLNSTHSFLKKSNKDSILGFLTCNDQEMRHLAKREKIAQILTFQTIRTQ